MVHNNRTVSNVAAARSSDQRLTWLWQVKRSERTSVVGVMHNTPRPRATDQRGRPPPRAVNPAVGARSAMIVKTVKHDYCHGRALRHSGCGAKTESCCCCWHCCCSLNNNTWDDERRRTTPDFIVGRPAKHGLLYTSTWTDNSARSPAAAIPQEADIIQLQLLQPLAASIH